MPNAILVKEGIIRGGKGIIPMWLLSLLKTKSTDHTLDIY